MVRRFEIEQIDVGSLRSVLHGLRGSEDVIVIGRGGRKFPKEFWIELLERQFGLIADRRHFTPKWAADDAKRMERELIGAHAAAGATRASAAQEGGSSAVPQMAPADWWEISYQPDKAQAYAYSKTRQPLHTDNAWFADPAEINFFIMQKQAREGGHQTIYPLSRLIEDLSTEEPALFADLSTVPVTIRKGDNDYFNRTPIIALGEEPRVYWNFYRTEKPSPAIKEMCDAFFAYLERKESTSSVEQVRCESGDCLSFNDLKMLHGRTAFSATEPRDRVLLHSMWKLPPLRPAAAAA